MRHLARKLAILFATALAIGSPILQNLAGWGLSPSEFAAEGDETLRAAGYAFSIWGLIYAALAAFALYQALPRSDGSTLVARVAAPAVLAIAGSGAWIWLSAADQRWGTVAVILAAATAAIAALLAARGADPARGERWLVLWPLGFLAGWLTIAAPLNVVTVLTSEGLVPPGSVWAAAAGILAAAAAAVAVLWATRLPAYAIPVAWGLVAVFVAERPDNLPIALLALAAVAVTAAAAILAVRPRRSRKGF